MHGPRQPPPSLSLGSLGDFAHLLRVMSAYEDTPRPMPPTKLHALKTSSSRVCREAGGLAFGSFESIEQPAFPEIAIRESSASLAASFFGVHREVHTSRRSTRSSSERLDRAAVIGSSPLRAFHRAPAFQTFTFEHPSRVRALLSELFSGVCPESNEVA